MVEGVINTFAVDFVGREGPQLTAVLPDRGFANSRPQPG
jgi:hypothetical protein